MSKQNALKSPQAQSNLPCIFNADFEKDKGKEARVFVFAAQKCQAGTERISGKWNNFFPILKCLLEDPAVGAVWPLY